MWKHLKLEEMCVTDIFSGTSSCDHALEITKDNCQHLIVDVLGLKPHTYLYEGKSRCSRAHNNLPTTWRCHQRRLSSRRCISCSTTASLRGDRRGGGGVTAEATAAELTGTVTYSIKEAFLSQWEAAFGSGHALMLVYGVCVAFTFLCHFH